jgi:hypothetical protein
LGKTVSDACPKSNGTPVARSHAWKYAAEPGVSEEEPLKGGTEEKSKKFAEDGAEVYAQA